MVITLQTARIVDSIKTISHRELAVAVPDVDIRYKMEAGSEKMVEVNRCILEAIGRVRRRCSRFLADQFASGANNAVSLPENYNFEFIFSERRATNKAESLAAAMHDFVVEYALSKFYSIVSQGELSNKHSILALSAGEEIDNLIYKKNPPRI